MLCCLYLFQCHLTTPFYWRELALCSRGDLEVKTPQNAALFGARMVVLDELLIQTERGKRTSVVRFKKPAPRITVHDGVERYHVRYGKGRGL